MRATIAFVLAIALAACGDNAPSGASGLEAQPPQTAELVPPRDAIAGAFVPQLDPHTLNDAEIAKALPGGHACVFRYTSSGKPVVVIGGEPRTAAIKVNGKLATLPAGAEPNTAGGGAVYESDGVRVTITADSEPVSRVRERRDADLQFDVGTSLRVGYRGYYECTRDGGREPTG